MIGKATTGAGFGGLSRYLATGRDGDAPERVAWVEARNLPTDDHRVVPLVMQATAALSRRVQKPVYHLSVSWPEEDQIDQPRMRQVADRLLSDLGLSEHQAVLVAHNDTDHPHLHVMVNRVHPRTGKAWSTSMDFKRIEQSLRAQEKELALREVPGRHTDKDKGRTMPRRPGMTEFVRRKRLGEPAHDLFAPSRAKQVRAITEEIFGGANSWAELDASLSAAGFQLRAKGQGLILSAQDGYAKLSQITPKTARLPALEERFGESFKAFWERTAQQVRETSVDALDEPLRAGLRRNRQAATPQITAEDIAEDLQRKERERAREAARRNTDRDRER